MTEQQRIEDVLKRHLRDDIAARVASVLAAELCAARTITTREELDALPVGSVVVCPDRVDQDGDVWGEGAWQKTDDPDIPGRPWFYWAMDFGEPSSEVPLPAVLVWRPEVTS